MRNKIIIFSFLIWVFTFTSCTYIEEEMQTNPAKMDQISTLSKFPAKEPITRGYNNWATCTAEPGCKILNGPGLNYPRSTVKRTCYYGKNAYVQGTVRGTDGRLYAKLPGWGTHVSGGRKYGYAAAKWLTKGYMVDPYTIHDLLESKGYSESTENRIFNCKTKKDAEIVAKALQACCEKMEELKRKGYSDSKITAYIKRTAGTIPVIGNFITFLTGGIDDNTVFAGYGIWKIYKMGKFYKIIMQHA